MYEKIKEFCSIKNKGTCYQNGKEMPPRVKWLVQFIESIGIEYEIDEFESDRGGDNLFYNIVMKGNRPIAVVAHHDIVNPKSDNANDNSCSVINAIMVKKLSPNTTVIILDGEEPGGIGSQRASEKILEGEYGNISSVLNLELSGKGGKNFFVGNYNGPLKDKIVSIFDPPVVNTPYNDSVTFRKNGIDSVVINPLPITDKVTSAKTKDGKYLDMSMLYNCHSMADSLDTIDTSDMKEFVEEVVMKII